MTEKWRGGRGRRGGCKGGKLRTSGWRFDGAEGRDEGVGREKKVFPRGESSPPWSPSMRSTVASRTKLMSCMSRDVLHDISRLRDELSNNDNEIRSTSSMQVFQIWLGTC